MGEGFIVRRGGGGQQTVKPIYNSLTETGFTSLTLSVTNDSNSITTLYYSVVQPEPGPTTSDTFDTEFAGKETKDITITGLTSGTTYTVYIKAIAIGEFPSETVIVPNLTTGVAITATGGTTAEYDSGGKRYKSHTFTSNGTFTVTQLSNMGSTFNQVDYLIVAGGGGGAGAVSGGGGGAGGLIDSSITITTQSYPVVVGAGGNGGAAANNTSSGGLPGANSSVFSSTAIGGGRAVRPSFGSGLNGGSGGGGSLRSQSGGSGTSGQGNNGGGVPFNSSYSGSAGGGGGAATAGVNGAVNNGGNGGNGINWKSLGTFYAGGGGGGGRTASANVGIGGSGGGANGSFNNGPRNGTVNRGGGGGGGGGDSDPQSFGGSGGSGIVIIRYEIAPSV
jgi:hypothetical protein